MASLALTIRVYLEDTDAQGIVYNANYLRFMERARTEWLRARDIDHGLLRSHFGVQLVLTRIEVDFRAPAHLGDLLRVEAEVVRARGARVVFHQQVLNDTSGTLLCRGVAAVGCIGSENGRPQRLPEPLRLVSMDELKG